jgi:hypothetical protein
MRGSGAALTQYLNNYCSYRRSQMQDPAKEHHLVKIWTEILEQDIYQYQEFESFKLRMQLQLASTRSFKRNDVR